MQAILKILEIIWSYSMDDECTIETFKVISQSGGGGVECLGVQKNLTGILLKWINLFVQYYITKLI